MDRRFTLKDGVLFLLLTILIVMVWLAMVQYDRQWKDMQATRTDIKDLTSAQSELRNQIYALENVIEDRTVVAGDGLPRGAGDGQIKPKTKRFDPHERLKKATGAKDFAKGDWLIDAFGSKVASITPIVYKDLYGQRVNEFVIEPLIELDPETMKFRPHIARSWSRSEDGKTVTFQLRKGVVFSDGKPLTSADVVYTWEMLRRKDIDAAARREFYNVVVDTIANGPYEVIFKLKEKHYAWLSMCGWFPIIPKHFYEQYTTKQINENPGLLMGSGPYRLKDPKRGWKPGELIELVRNENYWGPKPGFDRLIWREVTNDVARMTMFKNGEIDMYLALPKQYDALLSEPEVKARSINKEYLKVPSGYQFIAWQQKRDGKPTKFADKRVREAMTYLTPRQRICDVVWKGYAEVANGPFTPGSNQYNPDLPTRKFNVEKGRRLLKEAGWEDRDGDGVLENAAGEKFKFTFTYPTGTEIYKRTSLLLKDSYASVGIIMELDPIEFAVYTERLENQTFDAVTMFWGGGAAEADIRQMFHTVQAKKGGDNFMNYRNKKTDELIDKARKTLDEQQRYKLWQQVHAILHEDQPYTFMLVRKTLLLTDKRIKNVRKVTEGVNDRYEWYVPRSMRKRGL